MRTLQQSLKALPGPDGSASSRYVVIFRESIEHVINRLQTDLESQRSLILKIETVFFSFAHMFTKKGRASLTSTSGSRWSPR
jgi:hypothetical protein